MQWIQIKAVAGKHRPFARSKCSRCGTTQEVPTQASAKRPLPLPQGWSRGEKPNWHLCGSCDQRQNGLVTLIH